MVKSICLGITGLSFYNLMQKEESQHALSIRCRPNATSNLEGDTVM